MASGVATAPGRFFSRPESLMLAALAAAAVILVSAAIIGGRHAQTSTAALAGGNGGSGDVGDLGEFQDYQPGESTDGGTVPGGTGSSGGAPVQPGPAAPGVVPGGGNGPATQVPGGEKKKSIKIVKKTGERVSETGATREGVHADYFEFGIHGPLTLDGAPLNLAEDPVTGIKGYITYVNKNGGINGLKVRMFLVDDRYTVEGGQQAADKLVKEVKPFIISGTLGIDQIAKVAKAANAAKIPYFAGGGPEPEFKGVMFQNIANYDQDAKTVVKFICKFGKEYVGENEVRIGTSTLNTPNILPVEKRFIDELNKTNCVKKPIPTKARGTIQKPTEQSTYSEQMINLRTAYGSDPLTGSANLIVPFQDPVTTSRQVAEWAGSGYRPKWTISNFAHESNTVLELMHGEWSASNPACNYNRTSCAMRVMALACYYLPDGGGSYDPNKCAKLGEAHRQWTSLGKITYDENAGGGVGGHTEYTYDEKGWDTDGSGGSSGYQGVYFWYGAMKSIGTDPTREKFVEALKKYNNYSDLLTGPITFSGSPNYMIGTDEFVLFESQTSPEWKQLSNITPGLTDHF